MYKNKSSSKTVIVAESFTISWTVNRNKFSCAPSLWITERSGRVKREKKMCVRSKSLTNLQAKDKKSLRFFSCWKCSNSFETLDMLKAVFTCCYYCCDFVVIVCHPLLGRLVCVCVSHKTNRNANNNIAYVRSRVRIQSTDKSMFQKNVVLFFFSPIHLNTMTILRTIDWFFCCLCVNVFCYGCALF